MAPYNVCVPHLGRDTAQLRIIFGMRPTQLPSEHEDLAVMSADSDPHSAPTPSDESSNVPEKLPVPPAKRRFRRDADEGESQEEETGRRMRRPGDEIADAEADLREEIRGLNARLSALTERRASQALAPETEARGAKYHRLTRKAMAPALEPGAAASAPPPAAAPVQLPQPMLTRGPYVYEGPGLGTWSVVGLGIVGLLVLAFYLGSKSVRPTVAPAAATAPPAPWSAADVSRLDQVLENERKGDVASAFSQVTKLEQQLPARLDLAEYAGALQVRLGLYNDAEADLARRVSSVTAPGEVATLQSHLGFLYARRRNFDSAVTAFSNAALAKPLDPLPFYYWGESLRRGGRIPEALDKFKETLLRLPQGQPESDSLWQCAALKMRLCQIETGNDADLVNEMEAQLRLPVPSAYWLVTAVAYDLTHNDSTAAVAALQRMKVVSQPELVDALLNDYYLRAAAVRNRQVAAYFPELTTERQAHLDARMALFIDP